ncbi:pyrroline-5-carboxylate reductase [Candidatus Methylomirabilis lanthanidiphila]|uniref:Pyrroline-5-carboxylate reductase n=1 Tax=Candidatus Methylomirabilis lanthanidiphila TaxID=2211376 RepID=A0A564ZM85_9BACT|nr:pyrroline-5-carboxylate reductase [Candidatus Methylomirabilis lanthanidiphila]VUZ85762.1 pyrroline-5-carboxylate reductase [Candidatus Methylomirabilis lanthanidiphila]
MLHGRTIGFIGSGNMAEAMIRGLLEAKLVTADQIIASDIVEARRQQIHLRYDVETVTEGRDVGLKASILILAVKPQDMEGALHGIAASVDQTKTVISVAAGITIAFIAERLPAGVRIVRAMPNAPALVLAGAAGIAKGEHATAEDLQIAEVIFAAVGKTVVVEEKHLDAVTGLSGSGPAYVFLLIEALTDAGVKVGLARDVAGLLAAQTVLGAAKMVLESGRHPAELKDTVASPGGTTIAGLYALERGGLRGILIEAVEAATSRSRELGRR